MVSWALVVLIVFPLLQVPAVLYLGKFCKLDEGETPGRPPAREYWRPSEGDPEGTPGTGATEPAVPTTTCPTCGTENAAGFSYCGECAASLAAD